jgi:hypothetical protein
MTGILASLALVTASGSASDEPGTADMRGQYRANLAEAARLLDVTRKSATTGGPYQGVPVPMEIRTASGGGPDAARSMGCLLLQDGSERLTSSQCLGCHRGEIHEGSGHPVEVDYDSSWARVGVRGRVRPTQEAVRRGAFLPDGKVRCVSCHDGRSVVRYHLALPPGAEIRPAVHAGDSRTYEQSQAIVPVVRVAAIGRQPASAERQEAAVKPLCLTCHPMD